MELFAQGLALNSVTQRYPAAAAAVAVPSVERTVRTVLLDGARSSEMATLRLCDGPMSVTLIEPKKKNKKLGSFREASRQIDRTRLSPFAFGTDLAPKKMT